MFAIEAQRRAGRHAKESRSAGFPTMGLVIVATVLGGFGSFVEGMASIVPVVQPPAIVVTLPDFTAVDPMAAAQETGRKAAEAMQDLTVSLRDFARTITGFKLD